MLSAESTKTRQERHDKLVLLGFVVECIECKCHHYYDFVWIIVRFGDGFCYHSCLHFIMKNQCEICENTADCMWCILMIYNPMGIQCSKKKLRLQQISSSHIRFTRDQNLLDLLSSMYRMQMSPCSLFHLNYGSSFGDDERRSSVCSELWLVLSSIVALSLWFVIIETRLHYG